MSSFWRGGRGDPAVTLRGRTGTTTMGAGPRRPDRQPLREAVGQTSITGGRPPVCGFASPPLPFSLLGHTPRLISPPDSEKSLAGISMRPAPRLRITHSLPNQPTVSLR
jgi:hypothetical protein